MIAHHTGFCADVNPPSDILDRGGRPRIWTPIPDTNGYDRHPDGRVRDRHRHVVRDVAIVEALCPPAPVSAFFLRLACCGLSVRWDRPSLAQAHWSYCLQDMLAEDGIPKSPHVPLDWGRLYSRDPRVMRPRRHALLGMPHVLAHNGRLGSRRRIRTMPWATAIQIMSATTTFGGESVMPKAG